MNLASAYQVLHQKLRRDQGRAVEHRCAECGNAAAQWAYDRQDPDEVVADVYGRTLTISLDPNHYEPLCRPCHHERDRRPDTHCINGHKLEGDNVYVRPSGGKLCRTCRRETQRAWREANPAWREGVKA